MPLPCFLERREKSSGGGGFLFPLLHVNGKTFPQLSTPIQPLPVDFRVAKLLDNMGYGNIEAAFDQWGDGARGIIRVKWHKGNGHFFSVRRENGSLIYEDPQNGTVLDIDKTLKMCTSAKGQLWFMRVDDRDLTDLVEEAVENV